MANINRLDLHSHWGASNTIYGTDGRDNININYSMIGWGQRANNLIHLRDGADNLRIGGQMLAMDGRNTIVGDNGQKNITIQHGLHAGKDGVNEILLADTVRYFTANHNLTVGVVHAAHQGQNVISTGNGDDKIAFTGHFDAVLDGENIITLGDGSKDLSFKSMVSSLGGKNIVDLGVGNQKIVFDGLVHAGYGGTNQILSDGGNVSVHFKFSLDAIGVNDIHLGEGKNKIVIDHAMVAHAHGVNRIDMEGEATLDVGGAMISHYAGLNQITTGIHDDVVSVRGGLFAYSGSNQIITGEGHDRVNIKGPVIAAINSTNMIDTGEGNDVIQLDGHVIGKSLTIDAGEGYDTLVLQAANVHIFNVHYRAWFSDMYQTSALAGSAIEEIKIDIIRNGSDLKHIDWLTQMINQHNAGFGEDIAISLALDKSGARINLGDIFTPRNESSISIIDLTGGHHNELRISDTLASNGYDGDVLRIDGDSNDRVGIDDIWIPSGSIFHENEKYYHVWENLQGESLWIQDGMDIHVY